MLPVFPIKLILIVLAVAAVGAVLGVAAAAVRQGKNVFKMQGVAWFFTALMIIAAICIGQARSNAPTPDLPHNAPGASDSYVWDDAGVLSSGTKRTLNQRNDRLWDRHNVTIGVVTCNYGGGDLYDYAWKQAEAMGLGGYDMIVALDISGDNYYLLTGSDLSRDFTDWDSAGYLDRYMETPFAKGDYDKAVLKLTEALEGWYDSYYG